MPPTAEDHTRIEEWMTRSCGAGPVSHHSYSDEYYIYQAPRRLGTRTVSYTLEITQEAFDHDGTATILANLDAQKVADMLLTDPATHLRYCEGGVIVPSPVQPKRH